jgi:8-oxo-dGTP diphosphatase
MSDRAGIVLIENGMLALIERWREGRHYFAFPGGHVNEGETPEQAAVREAEEELGLQVRLGRLVAKFNWQGMEQYYYLAEGCGGTFGSGQGEELHSPAPGKGSYLPRWMPVQTLLDEPVMPRGLARLVVEAAQHGWPDQVVEISE